MQRRNSQLSPKLSSPVLKAAKPPGPHLPPSSPYPELASEAVTKIFASPNPHGTSKKRSSVAMASPLFLDRDQAASHADLSLKPVVTMQSRLRIGGQGRRSVVLPPCVPTFLQTEVHRPPSNMPGGVSRQGKKQHHNLAATRFHSDDSGEARNARVQEKAKSPQDIRLIRSTLAKSFIFNDLPEDQLQAVINAMIYYELPARETVFKQGSAANNFFILVSGTLEVVANGKQVKILRDGDSFGELALLHDTPRSATVRSLEACAMWGLDRQTFRASLVAINAQHYNENKAFIYSIEIFAVLTNPQKESLVHALASHAFADGHKIVNEGDPGDLFYIVKEGVVVCYKGGVELRRLAKGEFFGEQALLNGGTRTATVVAEGPVKCVSIGQNDLVQVLGSQLPHIIYRNTLRMALEKSQHLSRLTGDQTNKLIAAMVVKNYNFGEVVVARGTPKGAFLWVVLKGSIGVSMASTLVDSATCLGDQDLNDNPSGQYNEDLLSQAKEIHVAEISRSDFEACIGGSLRHATMHNEALVVLKRVQLLRGIPPDRLKLLVSVLEVKDYAHQEIIVQQNDPGDTFYIIKTGQVQVLKNGVLIRIITKHDYFGERAVLFDDFRSATVIASGAVSCWVLQKSDFVRILTDAMRKRLLARIEMQDDNVAINSLLMVKLIGKGMFGNVFLAVHPQKETLYALKTVSRDKVDTHSLHESLFLEKDIMLQLDHVFIVKLIKTFKDDRRFYFLMEFVKGMDLFDVLRKMGLLNENDSRFYVAAMVLMMEHLHERGIIYRDLKPENIMVDEEGYPRLIDFGIAKVVSDRTYSVIGTPHYMAPEVILGKGYNHTIDFYGIGVLLYEFLCGKVPFGDEEEDPYTIYQCVLEHRIVYPKFIDPRFPARELVEQLLSAKPAVRTGGGVECLKAHSWFNHLNWVPTT